MNIDHAVPAGAALLILQQLAEYKSVLLCIYYIDDPYSSTVLLALPAIVSSDSVKNNDTPRDATR